MRKREKMLPPFDVVNEVIKFAGAFSIATGAFAWWRKNSPEEDKIISDSCDILLEGVSDADKTSKIDLHTGKNIRDQLTVEQALELDRERKLRRMENRN